MKYLSDNYQEVLQLEEDPNGTYSIDKGFLPLIKIEDPDEDENSEYVAVMLILEDNAIKYQMLPADHGEVSKDNIRIISIKDNCILLLESDLETHTGTIQKALNWLGERMVVIDDAIQNNAEYIEAIRQKFGFEKECLEK